MTSHFFDEDFEDQRPDLAELGIQPCGAKLPICLSKLSDQVVHSPNTTLSHLFHNEADHEVPGQLSQYLRDYQKQGIKFIYSCLTANKGAILGDDMGLGKTIQVIGLLTALMGKTGQRSKDFRRRYSRKTEKTCNEPGCSGFLCFLIVCPASVMYNWADELERWGYFRVALYHRNQRASTLQHVKSGHIEIVLTSFETAREHIDSLNQVDWSVVVVDEVHRLKEPKARLTQSLKRLRCLLRLGLTGTAVQNNLNELWSILDWANPGCLGSKKEFSKNFSRPIERGQKQQATKRELAESYKKRKDLVSVWKQFLIRRTKKLISDQLPSKTDQVVYCRLSEFQKLIYEGVYKIPELQEVLLSFDPCPCGGNKTRGGCCYKAGDRVNRHKLAFTYMHLLLKVANHPGLLLPSPSSSKTQAEMAKKVCRIVFANEPLFLRLLETGLYTSLAKPKYCGKMEVLVEMLQVLNAESSKVLLFSYSTRVLDLLESFVRKQRYSFRRIDGSTKLERRIENVKCFNTDPGIFLMLLSTKAACLGLNITGANIVILFDPNWNPAHDLQAQDRAYRVGQSRDVRVFRLISSGCVEENVYLRQVYKQQLNHMTVESTNVKRYFQGIQGNHQERGEIFGLRNMLNYHPEGSCLTKDILERNLALEEKIECDDESFRRKLDEARNKAETLLKKKSGIANLMVGEYVSLSNNRNASGDEIADNADNNDDVEDKDMDQSDRSEDESGAEAEDESEGESDEESRVVIGEEESEEEAFGLASQFQFDVEKKSSEAAVKSNKSKKRIRFSADVMGHSFMGSDDTFRQKNRNIDCKSKDNSEIEDSESEGSRHEDYLKQKGQNEEEIEDFEDEGKDTRIQKKTINDIFKSGKVLHTHANETVVGGSRAEDYITKCAVRDVFELMQATQEPAHWCQPLPQMKEGPSKSPFQQPHTSSKSPAVSPLPVKTPLDICIKKSSVPLAVNCEQIIVLPSHTVLYGQTPRGIRRDQLMNMAETKGLTPLEFAKQVLQMSTQEKFSFLKDYYSSLNASHEGVFLKVLEKSSSHVKHEGKADTRYVDRRSNTAKNKRGKVISANNSDLSSEDDKYQEKSEVRDDFSMDEENSSKGKKAKSRRLKDKYIKKKGMINRKIKDRKSYVNHDCVDDTALTSTTFKNSNDGSKRKIHVLSSSESSDDISVQTLKKIQNSGKTGEKSKCAGPFPLRTYVEESEDSESHMVEESKDSDPCQPATVVEESDESNIELLRAKNLTKVDDRICTKTELVKHGDKPKETVLSQKKRNFLAETTWGTSSRRRHSEKPEYNAFISALLSDDESDITTEKYNVKKDLPEIGQVKEMTGHGSTKDISHKQKLDTGIIEQKERKIRIQCEDKIQRKTFEKPSKAADPDINYVLDGLFSDASDQVVSSPDKGSGYHKIDERNSLPCTARTLDFETHQTRCIFDELFGSVKSKTLELEKQTNQNSFSMKEKYDGGSSPCRCYFKCDGVCRNKVSPRKSGKDFSSLHKIL